MSKDILGASGSIYSDIDRYEFKSGLGSRF